MGGCGQPYGPLAGSSTRPWKSKDQWLKSDTDTKDLHGGWFDAGDYNKYTSWAARYIIVLLRAFDENPNAFGDDSGIPIGQRRPGHSEKLNGD